MRKILFPLCLCLLLIPGMVFAQDPVDKVITADTDGGPIAVMVLVGTQQTYTFTLTYNGSGGDLIVDTVPAEWDIVSINGTAIDYNSLPINVVTGVTDIVVDQANKKKNKRGSTKIRWEPDLINDTSFALEVVIRTRGRPVGKAASRYAPTSCGVLYLNEDGAEVYGDGDFDPATNMPLEGAIPDFVSNPLYIGAVKDLDGGGIDPTGGGDEDGDGLDDAEETGYNTGFDSLLGTGTSPCDSDNDGLTNEEEEKLGTDPLNPDTDGGGESDGSEVANGRDPLDDSDDVT
ncbi:thrombospondin type 3 repeat-containing protein [Candidatus Poribacteria bacterium]